MACATYKAPPGSPTVAHQERILGAYTRAIFERSGSIAHAPPGDVYLIKPRYVCLFSLRDKHLSSKRCTSQSSTHRSHLARFIALPSACENKKPSAGSPSVRYETDEATPPARSTAKTRNGALYQVSKSTFQFTSLLRANTPTWHRLAAHILRHVQGM